MPTGADVLPPDHVLDNPLSPTKWMLVSAAITTGMYVVCYVLQLHPVTLLMAMFYGPAIASYNARGNIVWRAALGGLVGFAAIIAFLVITNWDVARAAFAAALGSDPDPEWGISSGKALALGVPLLLAMVLPLSLTGASVGEHLATRRRAQRERDLAAAQAAAAEIVNPTP